MNQIPYYIDLRDFIVYLKGMIRRDKEALARAELINAEEEVKNAIRRDLYSVRKDLIKALKKEQKLAIVWDSSNI